VKKVTLFNSILESCRNERCDILPPAEVENIKSQERSKKCPII